MRIRAITGFFFIIVMIASNLLGHYVFGAFYLLVGLLALWEFYGLIKQSGINPVTESGLINGGYIYIVFALITFDNSNADYHKLLFLLPVTLSAIFIRELFKKSAEPFTNVAYTYLGLFFTIIPFTFFHGLAYVAGSFNFHYPLAFLLMLWTNDTFAYLTGRQWGRTKLFERHSPKKTWEGFIGGIVFTAVTALIINHFYNDLLWQQWVTIGVLISVFGTMGDLVESMFKRSINVKDSGGILPGHGGLLDRFDGLLMAAPIVYAYLYFIVNA